MRSWRRGSSSAQAPDGRGATPEGDHARAQGRYLRGLAWYELGTARGASLDAAAVAEWSRSVRAEYQSYLAARAARTSSRRTASNELQERAANRLADAQKRWRENPTEDDIRTGVALNALAADLADPAIPATKWSDAQVVLPDEISIQSLAFRFASATSSRRPAPVKPSTVAIGRMKVSTRWPIPLRRSELDAERAAYSRSIAVVIETCVKGKTLRAAEVDALRGSLAALREKAMLYAPVGSPMSKQVKLFLDRARRSDHDLSRSRIRRGIDPRRRGPPRQNRRRITRFYEKVSFAFRRSRSGPEGLGNIQAALRFAAATGRRA